METISKNSAKTLENGETTARKFAQDFKGDVREYSKEAVDTLTNSYETALEWAKKNPLQAAAIGAGAGFVLGAFIRKLMDRK